MEDPHDHDILRLDDDGAPHPEVVKARIGIAPTETGMHTIGPLGIARQTELERNPTRSGKSAIVLSMAAHAEAEGKTVSIVGANGKPLSSLTWPSYIAWRKTLCMPRDLTRHILPGVDPRDPTKMYKYPKQEWIEEIDQATHEFVGEVAELAELFMENGISTFFGEHRAKLIDECGDIFFCGNWALDAWGNNPLEEAPDGELELYILKEGSQLGGMADAIKSNDEDVVASHNGFSRMVRDVVFDLLIQSQTSAGLTANAFKKLKFQRREQDVDKQVGRIAHVLIAVNQILLLAGSSVAEALKSNQRKLNHRFPNGYQPGVGGGDRTGAGK